MNTWIETIDRLPDDARNVFLAIPIVWGCKLMYTYYVGHYNPYNKVWYAADYGEVAECEVSHWMEIPTVEEKVSEDLEEEVRKYIANNGYDGLDTEMEVQSIASHFANWQREKMAKGVMDGLVFGHGNCKIIQLFDDIEEGNRSRVKVVIVKENQL